MRPAELPPVLHKLDHKPTLEELQGLVGGYIELIPVPGRPNVQLFANEDGRVYGMPLNPEASLLARQQIVGPAVLLAGPNRID